MAAQLCRQRKLDQQLLQRLQGLSDPLQQWESLQPACPPLGLALQPQQLRLPARRLLQQHQHRGPRHLASLRAASGNTLIHQGQRPRRAIHLWAQGLRRLGVRMGRREALEAPPLQLQLEEQCLLLRTQMHQRRHGGYPGRLQPDYQLILSRRCLHHLGHWASSDLLLPLPLLQLHQLERRRGRLESAKLVLWTSCQLRVRPAMQQLQPRARPLQYYRYRYRYYHYLPHQLRRPHR